MLGTRDPEDSWQQHLADTIREGRRAGEAAAKFSQERDVQLRSHTVVEEANDELNALIKPGDELARSVQRAIRNLMWEHCGVVRDGGELLQGLNALSPIREAATIDRRAPKGFARPGSTIRAPGFPPDAAFNRRSPASFGHPQLKRARCSPSA